MRRKKNKKVLQLSKTAMKHFKITGFQMQKIVKFYFYKLEKDRKRFGNASCILKYCSVFSCKLNEIRSRASEWYIVNFHFKHCDPSSASDILFI